MLSTSAQALAEAIVHAHSYRDPRNPGGDARTALFTIAMTRRARTRSTAIAEEVGKRLGWPVYDQALVEKIAQEMNLRARLLESVDERRMSWLEECLHALTPRDQISHSSYIKHMVQTVLSLGSHGSCIIVGRGAVHLLPPTTTLRVRIVAEREDRISNLAQEMKISRDEAARQLDRIDRDRQGFIRDNFGKDSTDPEHYDVILNSSHFTTAECAELILEALQRRQNHLQESQLPFLAK